jgi:3-oxochol-4-en-24-oyl-CoA dehydrogenase
VAIGIQDVHDELRTAVQGWAEARGVSEAVRAALDADGDALPPYWSDLAAQGLLSIHLSEEFGGQGAGLVELAVVAEELGRAAAIGPWDTTAIVAGVIAAGASASLAKDVLPGLADGSLTATLAIPTAASDGSPVAPTGLSGTKDADGTLVVSGTVRPLVHGAVVTHALVAVSVDGSDHWVLLEREDAAEVAPLVTFDLTRPCAAWSLGGARINPDRMLDRATTGIVRDLALVVLSAAAMGGARWCVDTAAEHARTREQFGRPIGQFQGIKHRVANMLVTVEQGVAATWDAAMVLEAEYGATAGDETDQGSLAVQLAAALALDGYLESAKGAIQVLGGMGFTWENDAHIHLRRATTLRLLVGGTSPLRAESARLALAGWRRRLTIDLPPEAQALRSELGELVGGIAAIEDPTAQHRALADNGLLAPHWPVPWGRDAGPVEQLVIDQVCAEAGLKRPNLSVAGWALPTIIAHGSAEQTERWVGPTLRGEYIWCQLFSEPGAGSDLAALTTRATRVDGGWSLTGQKVWTSVAQRAHWGICLARTNPDAPKHRGITYFLVDMTSPGIEVRPLREITGAALFNEVFFDECFVPDECVVGEVDGGWKLARTTLANERVSLSSDSAFGGALEGVLARVAARPDLQDPVTLDRLGSLLAEAQSLAQLGMRATLRSVGGLQPGPESSVRKLVGAEFDQRVHEFGLDLCGPEGAVNEGDAVYSAYMVLQSKCMTIAGGTSEVQRNVIGERLLGLPRDPEPGR